MKRSLFLLIFLLSFCFKASAQEKQPLGIDNGNWQRPLLTTNLMASSTLSIIDRAAETLIDGTKVSASTCPVIDCAAQTLSDNTKLADSSLPIVDHNTFKAWADRDKTQIADTGDTKDSANSDGDQSKNTVGSKGNGFGHVLKANIVQTFELDPRLKKDLTEGNFDLRPIRLMQDYFAAGYNPNITWTRADGQWTHDHDARTLALYLFVGPITKHLSGWFQSTPLVQHPRAFFDLWEMFQGLANYGTDKTTVQFRGGQTFNWENQGWGGADRTITQTVPGVYTAFNGFDPTATSKAVSLDVTGMNWTSGRIFGYWQPSTSTSSDPNIFYHRGYGLGLAFEKLFGKTGISGVQTNLTIGNTPVFNANIPTTECSPYIWWTSWINRSFQDKRGNVRLNPSFGLTVFNLKRYLDDPAVPEQRSTGFGYTFDLVAIPVTSYWTTILRFDDFRATDLISHNTTYTFTVGQALDWHGPNKSRMRVTFDYQFVGQRGTTPTHRLILAFWPIW